jgi:hypothetical protein
MTDVKKVVGAVADKRKTRKQEKNGWQSVSDTSEEIVEGGK